MQKYRKYELHTLVDLLSDETQRYTKMIAANIISGKEFDRCKRSIEHIQSAINWKKEEGKNKRPSNGENEWLFAF